VCVAKKVAMADEISKKAIPVEISKGTLFFSMLIRFKMHYYMVVRPIHPTDFAERVLCIV